MASGENRVQTFGRLLDKSPDSLEPCGQTVKNGAFCSIFGHCDLEVGHLVASKVNLQSQGFLLPLINNLWDQKGSFFQANFVTLGVFFFGMLNTHAILCHSLLLNTFQ